jgi:hypothetical protein
MKLDRRKFACYTGAAVMGVLAVVVFRADSGLLPVVAVLIFQLMARGLRTLYAERGGFSMIRLKLPRAQVGAPVAGVMAVAPARVIRKSLCDECAYARLVVGYEAGESLVTCGYAYPPQFIPFPV